MSKKKEYSNGEVTIVWKPDLCIHSANCVRGLPMVFDTNKRPWIDAGGASTKEIIEQVKKCPSGALTTYTNERTMENKNEKVKITLAKNGPILINGEVHLENEKGEAIPAGTTSALCRCGGSKNKPFCDGTHHKIGFTG
jgi:uncharacterized Fe-S cluster protein YjdI